MGWHLSLAKLLALALPSLASLVDIMMIMNHFLDDHFSLFSFLFFGLWEKIPVGERNELEKARYRSSEEG